MIQHPNEYDTVPPNLEYPQVSDEECEATKMLIEANYDTLADIEDQIDELETIARQKRNPRAQYELDVLRAICEAHD